MTRFSEPILYRCPECSGYFTRSFLASLHFYGDVPEWSDGRPGQWWAGLVSPVGRCPACSRVVWLGDAKELMEAPRAPDPLSNLGRRWRKLTGDRDGRLQAERDWDALPVEIKQAPSFGHLQGPRDMQQALDTARNLPPTRELYLRLRLWWASNDHLVRDPTKPAIARSVPVEAARANSERLLDLLQDDPDSVMTRVELLRQLGRFDDALAVIPTVPVKDRGRAEWQQQWCEARDAAVKVFPR